MTATIDPQILSAYLASKLDFYLAMLQEMVAINSFSANPAGVNHLAQLTARQFAPLGFHAELIPSADPLYGSHLILTRPGRTPRTIGCISHLDTVFPAAEETANQFHWQPAGERIYGPGTVDIKGGTVLIYMMLDALHHFTRDLYDDTTWVLLFDASEEANGEHFGQICRQRLAGPQTLAALIFEGGRLEGPEAQLVVARKGMAVYHVTVAGKAAHAGASHEQGANAIVQMAETVRQIASFTDYDRQITFNVGTIAGGTVVNRVPHFATATVEMRAFDQAVYEEGMAKMLALSGQASVVSGNGQYPCHISVTVNHTMPPWPRNAATDRLFAVWQAAAAALGLRALPEERGGLSDGNYFWQEIPTLDGLGPAGGNAHCSERSPDGSKEQEFVRPGSFIPKTLLNTTAVLALLRNETP